MNPVLRIRFTDLVGVELPVIQTGWAGARSEPHSCDMSSCALEVIASATMSLDQLSAAIARVKAASSNPFGVSRSANAGPIGKDSLWTIGSAVGSFAGPPTLETVRGAHDAGLLAMVTVGAPGHAEKMITLGVDLWIAQGSEGGGHTGAIPTSLLLPQRSQSWMVGRRCWVPEVFTMGEV